MTDRAELFAALDDEVEFEQLSLGIDGRVAHLHIERPEALNALNGELMLELHSALALLAGDERVGALIISGSGRAFVAGADVAELAGMRDVFEARETALAGQELMGTVAALPFLTVAAIHGFALGGGLELALACDLRVAAPGSKLGFPEVGLGLIPGYGGSQRLPRLIGVGRALDLILTGRHVDAEEALALGLVNRVAADPLSSALEIARQSARMAPVAVGLAKEAVMRGLDVTLAQGLEIEADLFGMSASTEDMREGTAAFLEKRAADFQGR
jgi:enoyl-CoA hydratase